MADVAANSAKSTLTKPQPVPTTQTDPNTQIEVRNAEIISGFTRAIGALQGAVPAAWGDRQHVASLLAERIPRITVARLIVWCRESGMDLANVSAKVLTDTLATEPGLMELKPEEAAEEAMSLIQSMWPQAAFAPRRPIVEERPVPDNPVVAKLRKLGEQWHRLSLMPIDQAKTKGPVAWRAKTLNDIAMAKAEGLREGLTRDQILRALESGGDRWVWEIPPPAREYFLDEFGQPPSGEDQPVPSNI